MQCPTDGTALVMSERSGIEIDYCPQCRGVWLDRGELDKIIERGSQMSAPQAPPPPPPQEQRHEQPRYEERRYEERRYEDRGYKRKKKKENWLSELFD
ncbi:MAG: zf-TFIIB domain-containing protein [Actinomycetia bacterium]|nr:zf-TFIIB domain-containing protein [Actinomycetes bacterium]